MSVASAEQVLALHEELLTLVRAGLPLDRGLRQLAGDVPGRLQPLVRDLAARLEQGQDVASAIAGIPSPSGRAYAAVLAAGMRAGMRAGRPAAALEGVVSTARRALDFRKVMVAELVYPLIVTLVGVVLLTFSLSRPALVQVRVSEQFGAGGLLTSGIKETSQRMPPGWIVILAALGVGLTLFLLLPRWVGSSPLTSADRWRPLRRIRQWQTTAILCDLLALLIENDTPLPAALRLAGAATSWPPLAKAVEEIGNRMEAGQTAIPAQWPLSPSVAWLVQHPERTGLVAALRREAEHYRRRTNRLQHWFAVYFPGLLTLLVGVICLVALAAINLGPLLNLYYHMSSAQF